MKNVSKIKAAKTLKINRTVVMRVTPEEAAKLRYQRKFDIAWGREQAQHCYVVESWDTAVKGGAK